LNYSEILEEAKELLKELKKDNKNSAVFHDSIEKTKILIQLLEKERK
jgi:hypothetical protein